MPRAIWNSADIAESDDTVVVERTHYCPRESVKAAFLRHSATTSLCDNNGMTVFE